MGEDSVLGQMDLFIPVTGKMVLDMVMVSSCPLKAMYIQASGIKISNMEKEY